MRPFKVFPLLLLAGVVCNLAAAEEICTIPNDKVNKGAIYWGDPSRFAKPAYVDYDALIQSTPECKEMKKKKLSSSDPASWILMSDAADRVGKAIAHVAKDKKYDFICAKEYWKKLKLDVKAPDITKLVKEIIGKLGVEASNGPKSVKELVGKKK